jgi:hypothetical protein
MGIPLQKPKISQDEPVIVALNVVTGNIHIVPFGDHHDTKISVVEKKVAMDCETWTNPDSNYWWEISKILYRFQEVDTLLSEKREDLALDLYLLKMLPRFERDGKTPDLHVIQLCPFRKEDDRLFRICSWSTDAKTVEYIEPTENVLDYVQKKIGCQTWNKNILHRSFVTFPPPATVKVSWETSLPRMAN